MRPSEIRAAAWAAAALLLLLPLAAGTPFLLHKRRSDASAALHNHGGSRAPAFAHGKGNADREVPGFWDELAYERARTVEEGSALLAEERARRGREMEERRLRAEEGRAKGGAAVGALEAERRRMARRQLVARKTTKRAARKTTRKAVRKTTSRRRKTTSRRRLTTSRRRLTTKRGAGDAVAPRPTTAAPKVTTPPAVVRTTKAPAPPPPPPPAKTTTRPPSPPPPPPPAPPPPPPPSPSAPKSTINPQPTPPPPAAAIATKDAQDPTLPIPPGPLSVLLVSETAFSIGWGTFANGRGVRAYGSRFWDSDSRVTGFAVDCFSAASASDPVPDGRISKAFVTPYRAIQVELTPQEAAASKTWGCTVRTVSASGVGPLGAGMRIGVSLSAGEARVAALRASAARFLDFNAPLSPPDPRSFLVLHSPCADPASTSAYVPASHLLMTSRNLDSPLCPPGSPAAVSVKPLGTLDFSGGAEALVGWETDGVPDWSSSFTVMLVPNPSADRADPGFGTNLPTAAREYDSFSADKSDFLAVHQVAGNLLSLRRKWTSLAERSDLDSLDLGLGVPGMRRAFVLRVSKGSIALSLAGTEVLRAAVPGMDWDRAQVLLQLAGNDTDGPTAVPLHRVSVDNLWWSRSAPAPAPVQGNVLDYPYSTQATYRRVVPGQQLAFAVDINAEPTGAASILLHFSYANFGGKPPMWEWRNALCVLAPGRANGVAMNVYGFVGVRSIPCSSAAAAGAAEQTAGQVAAQFGAPGAWPGTWIVRLDPAWVARGTNVFLFDLLGPVLVGDLHVELTYPAASVPAYAPAAHWLAPFLTASNPEPTAAWLGTGPAAGLARVQGVEVWGNHPLFFRTGLRVNSTVLQVEWEAGTALAGRIRGAEFAQRGVARVELLVAGQVAQRYTYPRPGMGYVYGWADVDLVPLADWSQGGDRRLGIEVRAYDSAGNPWFADYDGVGAYGLPYGTWRGKNVTLGMVAELGQPKAVAGLPVFPPRSDPALPAVGNVQVVEDDRVATLSWDSLGHFTEYGTRFWARKLSGYLVTWYPISNTSAALKIPTAFRATQLQPLVPGVLYGAVVQAIDAGTSAGRLGPPSAEVRFRSNASRVDALRQACSGFFDDMNIGAGQFDPAKWVTSYSLCTDPAASANFVNGQFHGHNAVKTSGRCPSANLSDIYPAMVTSRPIGVFDFTDTTGTIAFDFDGPSESNYWFLDFVPGPDEDRFSFSGPAHQPVAPMPALPEGALRLHAAGNKMLVEVYDGNRGWEAANVNVRDFGIDFTPNLRRPFLIRMSRSTFTLDVSGTRLMTVSNLGLPFQRGSVHFQQFANVTNANSMPLVTVHWDNFGFSSVSPARRVVRSYRGTNDANYRLAGPTLDVSEFTYSVSIPDDLSQATAARLKFSRQGDRNSNERFWDGTAVVCFNDRAYTVWGQPTVCTAMVPGWTPVNRTIGPVASGDPQGVILQLPAAALRASNRIIISLPANMWVGDVHVEVDFPAGYAGAYTPPRPWFGDLPAPTFHPGRNVASGPMAKLTRIAGNLLWETPGLYAAMVAPGGIPVGSTMLLVEGEADSSIGFQVMGRAVGVVRIELQLDRRTVRTWTFPSPGIQYYYWSMELDVSDLAPGPHELHTVAYDEEGRISIPNYDFPNILPDRKLYPGAYMPAKITI